MFAIIETGGKQYKVSEGDILFIEKLEAEDGSDIVFDNVLAYSDGKKFSVGKTVKNITVSATVVKTGKAKKIRVFRYKAKKNEKRCMGHRQPYTKVQIKSITKEK